MIARPGRRFAFRIQLILVIAIPILALAAGEVAEVLALRADPAASRTRLERDAARLGDVLDGFLALVGDVSLAARESTPARAMARARRRDILAQRLEGVGVVDAGGAYLDWEGTPEEIDAAIPGSNAPVWVVRVEGAATRLIAVTAPDAVGRRGVATVLLSSSLPGLSVRDLLPSRIVHGSLRALDFIDRYAPGGASEEDLRGGRSLYRGGPSPSLVVALNAPKGPIVALATFQETAPEHRAAERRTWWRATAAVLFVALLALVFDWRKAEPGPSRTLGALFALIVGRAALLLAKAPGVFLPRELASASLFGVPWGLGLAGSPADLLISGIAVYLAARMIGRVLRHLAASRPTLARIASPLTVLGFVVLTGRVAATLALDSRVPLLRPGKIVHSVGEAVIVLGLVAIVLATAETIATTWVLFRPRTSSAFPRPGPWVLGASVLLPAAVASVVALTSSAQASIDRLRSEFAPKVAEQTARRRLALVVSVRDAARSARAREALREVPDAGTDFTAYRIWSESDLFHVGYESSLEVRDAEGRLRSRFAFGLPPLTEPADTPVSGTFEVEVREEVFSSGSLRQKVLHAEAAVPDGIGGALGTVVGHILDEPRNLPFLPWSATYLSVLGHGRSQGGDDDEGDAPDYGLYDRAGNVLLHTMHQPPAAIPALWEAAATGRTLEIRSSGQPYVALAWTSDDRMNLLLTSRLTLLDQMGGFARLVLLSWAALIAVSLAPELSSRGGTRRLARAVRASLYRKLLATLLVASVVPLVGLALFVRGTVARRAEASLADQATQIAGAVQRVLEDYSSEPSAEAGTAPRPINDEILHWLSAIVGQDIHLYRDGLLIATSRRELFASGLFVPRLPGDAQHRVVRDGLPYLFRRGEPRTRATPVAYARVRLSRSPGGTVAAVPLILQERESARAVERVTETLLLATVFMAGLLAAAAGLTARTVSRPVRELVGAAGRIAHGDFEARLVPRTHDEVASLVEAFGAMSAALGAQRADLVRSRDYMAALLRHATLGIVSTGADGRIVTLNPMAAALLEGPDGPPGVGTPLRPAVEGVPGLAPLATAFASAAFRDGLPVEIDVERSGEPLRLRAVRAPLPDPAGGDPGSLILLDDVTDLMVRNQLAAWAEMARAIAHEIKNPLTPIRLSAQHLERLLRDRGVLPSEDVNTCLETILKQVEALREISADFSAFAKLPELRRTPLGAAPFLRDILAPYAAMSPAGVVVVQRVAPDCEILADPRVLGRALINLIENALQAMPGGGTLTVGARPDPPTRGAVVFVADTGPGLDPDVRRHLFEPYFSTKSSGTGLGLSIVKRSVEAHGGSIEVESAPGRGTTFSLHLPGD